MWDPATRDALCIACDPGWSEPTRGLTFEEPSAGASAGREHKRRDAHRRARERERSGPLAPVVLALRNEPQHIRAWARGAEGERKVAKELERRTANRGVVLLHDRQMPGSRGNIDHIAVGPSGVAVIDAKHYRGRIAVERRGGLFRERSEHLVVAGRDRTNLIDGVLAQADAVRALLAGGPHVTVPVRAMLCFVDGDWPWGGPLEVRGVGVLTPRRAAKLCAAGTLPAATVTEIADALQARLVPA